MNKRKITIISLCTLVIFIATISTLSLSRYKSQAILNGKIYKIEVADTSYLLEKGLSGHKPLDSDEGMLFIFSEAGNYGFWMKDMLFPIDIIWFSPQKKVVHIEKNVSPSTYPKIFYPNEDAMYVLEISAGQSQEINLKKGDSVEFLSKKF